ncbi:hypothetical protein ACFQZE_21635 [Paenibacillus sp. GCM10027627]|uniref:hypothetical protein n=1 Tax=unclassified Paenibacillus TaxID=185978 RepID=UPI00362723E2
MFGKWLQSKLLFVDFPRRVTVRAASGRELVRFAIERDKPIPPASHGTIRLRGKQ